MKYVRSWMLVVALACLATGAQAALVGRDINGLAVTNRDSNGVLDSSAVFLYDTVLNVTWLRDANYALTSAYANADSLGRMNWQQANTWAADLNIGTYGSWRLPTMIPSPDATLSFAGGTDYGYNVRTKTGNQTQYLAGQTVYSEMAHLYYSTLGNVAFCNPIGSIGPVLCNGPQDNYGLVNAGDFKNLRSGIHWSALEYAVPNADTAWFFDTSDGIQSYFDQKPNSHFALAVRDGDVASAVPVPAAAWLMLSGIGALATAARRRQSRVVV